MIPTLAETMIEAAIAPGPAVAKVCQIGRCCAQPPPDGVEAREARAEHAPGEAEDDQEDHGIACEAVQAVGFARREPRQSYEEGKRPVKRPQRPVPHLDPIPRILLRRHGG